MLLAIDRLTKIYPNGTRANDAVTIEVAAGEVFGLLGPNGAGKTTLVSQLLGLLAPTSGSIRLAGVDVAAQPAFARAHCSYQPQATVATAGLTPLQAIELCGRIRGGAAGDVRRRARELLASLDLAGWASKATPLSGGVARLVSFCMAAVHPGQLIILDEPTNDVDPLRRRLLWQEIRALADGGAGVLLVTHNVLEAERCVDRLAVIDRGKVVRAGTPAALKAELGSALRLEVVLDGPTSPELPRWAGRPARTGRRLIAEVHAEDAGAAVAWATTAQSRGDVAEFTLTPASLEDVYVRAVTAEEELDAALP